MEVESHGKQLTDRQPTDWWNGFFR